MTEDRKNPKRRRRIPWFVWIGAAAVVLVVGSGLVLRPAPLPESTALAKPMETPAVETLRPVAEFAAITDTSARSVALFVEAGRVIQSPRCMNCHPRTDTPTQTDNMLQHTPLVTRGSDGGGALTLRCSSCHQVENVEASGVPGNPKWGLAPLEMAWQGKSLGEICRQIQDTARGGMQREELLHHMAEDVLVGWAWHPGGDRKPAPGTQQHFGALIEAWLETGGKCPT